MPKLSTKLASELSGLMNLYWKLLFIATNGKRLSDMMELAIVHEISSSSHPL